MEAWKPHQVRATEALKAHREAKGKDGQGDSDHLDEARRAIADAVAADPSCK